MGKGKQRPKIPFRGEAGVGPPVSKEQGPLMWNAPRPPLPSLREREQGTLTRAFLTPGHLASVAHADASASGWAHRMRELRAFGINGLLTAKAESRLSKKKNSRSSFPLSQVLMSVRDVTSGHTPEGTPPFCLWPAGGSMTSFLVMSEPLWNPATERSKKGCERDIQKKCYRRRN